MQRLRARGRAEVDAGAALTAAMLESSLDCVVAMDHEGRVLEFNPAAERSCAGSRSTS